MAISIQAGASISVSPVFRDTTGAVVPAATLDAPPVWSVDQPTIVQLTAASGGGTTAVLKGLAVGTATVSLSASVGGKTVTDTSVVEVTALPVETVEIVAGDPV